MPSIHDPSTRSRRRGARRAAVAVTALAIVAIAAIVPSPRPAHGSPLPPQEPPAAEPAPPWEPRPRGEIPAGALRDDWVRLDSGEWLRGTIERLENDVLEFDSDELDDLELDWDDVDSLHCEGVMTCRFEDRVTATGRLAVRGKRVFVSTGNGVREFDRSDLLTIIRGLPTERNFWSGDFTLGFSARSGNTDQIDYNARASVERATPATRAVFEYRGAFGRVEGVESTNNQRGDARFDVRQTRSLFWTPVQLQALRDEFQNIDFRGSIGGGAGYHWIDRGSTDLEVAGGALYRYTRFDSVEPGEDRREGTAALFGRMAFEQDITTDVDFETTYEITMAVPETNDWTHSLRATLEIDLPRSLELDITGIWDRNNAPARDGDGNVPEKDDFTLTIGIGWDF